MLFTTVCLLNDLQRFVVFKIILIFYTILSFDYAKRITANFEDFIKKIEFLKIHNRKYWGLKLKTGQGIRRYQAEHRPYFKTGKRAGTGQGNRTLTVEIFIKAW